MKPCLSIFSFPFIAVLIHVEAFAQVRSNPDTELKERIHAFDESNVPRFQLTAGISTSTIDLSRYINYELCRGFHARIDTHVKGSFFISTEYSRFPMHEAPTAWDDIHTRKMDLNAHFSFALTKSNAHIFALLGIDRHEWTGRFTGIANLDQLTAGLKKGSYMEVKRWGLNAGVGFTQPLYENIGLTGDFRFNFSTPNGKFPLIFSNTENKFGIMDVMTTFGITYYISQLPKSKSKKVKTFGVGKKVYDLPGH